MLTDKPAISGDALPGLLASAFRLAGSLWPPALDSAFIVSRIAATGVLKLAPVTKTRPVRIGLAKPHPPLEAHQATR